MAKKLPLEKSPSQFQRRHAAITKALRQQKLVNRDEMRRKVRTVLHFKRPITFRPPRNSKYPKKAVPSRSNRLEPYQIIQYPLTTEAAMQKIEKNTIIFMVHRKANKSKIKLAIKKLYEVSVKKVHTLITPSGQKKALVRLGPESDALDLANKIGIV